MCSRNDPINAKAFIVAEQRGNMVAIRGRVEFDHAVASRVVHVNDMETESLDHRGQHQPGAIHGISKSEIERQVVGADLALDCRHHACTRFRVPADGAKVSLDDRK
jgi:hypothetical protein